MGRRPALVTPWPRLSVLAGGTPWPMAFIFVPLETISYSFRAVSLGVRLWVNMLAGHTLLHILTGARDPFLMHKDCSPARFPLNRSSKVSPCNIKA